MSSLDRIAACNACDLSRYRPFTIAGARVGWLRDDRAALLDRFDGAFAVTDETVTLDLRAMLLLFFMGSICSCEKPSISFFIF